MTRASDLRYAIAEQIRTLLPSLTVIEAASMRVDKEDMVEDSPYVVVYNYARELQSLQGPDQREVQVAVGIAAVPSGAAQQTTALRIAEELTKYDEFDATVEQIIELWTANGTLGRTMLAEHHFIGINQPAFIDIDYWNDQGVWFTMLLLTYRDDKDEDY